MAIPAGKTPISYLQEYCTKQNLTPVYELLAHEGSVHEPTFVMKVTVGETTAEGKSSSKKKAKHCAARAALSILRPGAPAGEATENDGSGEAVVKEESVVGNPVGELQEFTQKNVMKPPIYSFKSETGQPHERKFFCTIKLCKYEEKGEGQSKRAAKRQAATAMLAHLNKLTEGDGNQLLKLTAEQESDDEVPALMGSYSALKDKNRGNLLTPQQSKELQVFYETIMKSAGKQLKSAGVPAPAANYCQMLQDIADANRFEAAIYDLQERSTTGLFMTVLKLSTNPLTVCHGCGITVEDSRASAAHNALQYLRISMTQQ